jgi:predicted amino acid-binding ACT domain protein
VNAWDVFVSVVLTGVAYLLTLYLVTIAGGGTSPLPIAALVFGVVVILLAHNAEKLIEEEDSWEDKVEARDKVIEILSKQIQGLLKRAVESEFRHAAKIHDLSQALMRQIMPPPIVVKVPEGVDLVAFKEALLAEISRGHRASIETLEVGPSLPVLAKALVDKMDMIHEDRDFNEVWRVAQFRRGPYTGPTYKQELDALRSALAGPVIKQPEDRPGVQRDIAELLCNPISLPKPPGCQIIMDEPVQGGVRDKTEPALSPGQPADQGEEERRAPDSCQETDRSQRSA